MREADLEFACECDIPREEDDDEAGGGTGGGESEDVEEPAEATNEKAVEDDALPFLSLSASSAARSAS